MGMYNEMQQELEKLSPKISTHRQKMTTIELIEYYGWIADYTEVATTKMKYLELADKYRDSIQMFEPNETNRDINLIERMLSNNQPDQAIEELKVLLTFQPTRNNDLY